LDEGVKVVSNQLCDVETLASFVANGDTVALPAALNGHYSGASMVTTRALIRRGARNLHLLGVPALSFQADLLIGAGCVSVVETGSILLYEYGPASRFVAAQKAGTIEVRDTTCPAIHAGLIAGEKGLPFMPIRGIIGSDLLPHRERHGAWRVINNPFENDDPIVLAQAIRPDVALFHVPLADRMGNVWIGQRDELGTIARAARKTLVTFEEVYEGDMSEDDKLATAMIPAFFVTALSHQPKGAWPLNGGTQYGEDTAHLEEYAELAKSQSGFDEYLERHIIKTLARV
jgi:glutaconate CoA-transferase subunit A